jgi:Peptidase family M1 domain
VTQVTRQARLVSKFVLICLLAGVSNANAQSAAPASASSSPQPARATGPAEELYLQLQSVGLDPARTFHIRGVSLDRPSLHLVLDDGEIVFTADVAGRVTGALFEGDAELLLTPPDQGERASMMLFTGMAILEERISSAYLRFNDDTFSELQPYLRPSTVGPEFVAHLNATARNLADQDALRLLGTFSRALPVLGGVEADSATPWVLEPSDRMLHIRAQGNKLGTFDAYFDTKGIEQVWAGQSRFVEGQAFYDLWTSFTPQPKGKAGSTSEPKTRSEEVSISGYKIRAKVTPPTTLAAEASLQMEVHRGGGRTVYFELSRFLQVKEVDVDGHAAEFINNPAIDGSQLSKRGNDLVAVIFPEPLRERQILNLRFVYSGDVLSEAGGGLLYVGARGTWYPNRGPAMAGFDLEFHYPRGWTLVATGKSVPTNETPGTPLNEGSSEEQIARWVTERPITLAGFNLGKYEVASAAAGDVTVKAYAARSMEKAFPRPSVTVLTPPTVPDPRMSIDPIVHQSVVPSPARNAQAVADNGARALEFYSSRFGPFPYQSLELTQMPGRTSQGWPGLVFLSSFAFLTHDQAQDLSGSPLESALASLTLPHETAHQWWGDLVGWRSYRDQWIVEALANYCALMTLEKERPGDVHSILELYRNELAERNKDGEMLRDAGPVTLGLRLSSSHFPNGYEAISYGRGTWLFQMLRNMLLETEPRRPGVAERAPFDPDEPFVRALRKVRDRYAGKAISTRELFAVFEEDLPMPLWYEGHKSLEWFVRSWVEGTSLPVFSLHNVKYEKRANGIEVTGTIQQKETPQDYVSAVPVYAVVDDQKVLLDTVLADGRATAFRLAAPSGTRRVVLDPYQTVLTAPK